MIRINKPAAPPTVLTGRGQEETGRNCDAYAAHRDDYDRGVRTFSFDSEIYGHETVKQELIRVQHGKCCFCEAKITHISYGDVEHFRPKSGYRQQSGDNLGRPGYYWLAYEWTNLYLSCQLCNQRYKRNTFPLRDANRRCRNHLEDLVQEQPLFIDPGSMDPEEHIEFAAEQPVAKNGSLQGHETIEALGLRREPLRERRFDKYQALRLLKEVALLLRQETLGQEARAFLERAVREDAEYASMARCLMSAS